MGEHPLEQVNLSPEPSAQERLESWKEIAHYLKRDVRTVQRWEKREGLPIHRHVHDKLATAYAYRSELDAWWQNRHALVEDQEPEAVASLTQARVWRLTLLILAIGLLVVAVLLRELGVPGLGTKPSPLAMVRISAVPNSVVRVSPDGAWLASVDPLTQKVFVQRMGGGTPRILVDDPVQPQLAWSHDSRRLAVLVSLPTDREHAQLESVEISSGKRSVLWQGDISLAPEPHDWTPDGSQILCRVRRPERRSEIRLFSMHDRKFATLQELPASVGHLQMSPLGKLISYASGSDWNWDVFVLPIQAGAQPVRVTSSPARDTQPFWTRDGRGLVFSRVQGRSTGLWQVEIDPASGQPRGEHYLMATPFPRAQVVSLTRGGDLLIVRRKRYSQLALMQMDPALGRPVEDPKPWLEEETIGPAWSADGSRVYFMKILADGQVEVAERAPAESGEHTIRIPENYSMLFLTPSPKNGWFTFYGSDENEERGIFEFNAESGQVRRLWMSDGDFQAPMSWSPDGTELLLSPTRSRNGQYPILGWRPGGPPRTIAYSTTRPTPKWSRSGRQIAYTDGECLKVMSRDGQTSRQVVCTPRGVPPRFAAPNLGSLSWSHDDKRIAWIVHNESKRRIEMWFVDVESAKHTVWPGAADYLSWPSAPAWSPDGTRLVLRIEHKPDYEIWRLADVLGTTAARRESD